MPTVIGLFEPDGLEGAVGEPAALDGGGSLLVPPPVAWLVDLAGAGGSTESPPWPDDDAAEGGVP
jgi:hypothetical protein